MRNIDAFLDNLVTVLGSEHVVHSPDRVDILASVTIHRRVMPRAYVYPGNTLEIQEIVKLANKHQVPLWVCSRGNNWGYGAATPYQPDSVVINLERLNRIVQVNEELAYAVIEPGVSYEQLNRYLKEKKHKLWIDCTDGTPKGSVIGNALDRGIGETPYGDHFGNLCGLEVILPDGELLQTGGVSNGSSTTWHIHKWGIGPYSEGLFSQGNFGIVASAGIWLMPEPEAYNSYVFEIYEEKHVPAVIDKFRQLALHGVVTSKLHMINDFVSLTVLTQRIKENIPHKGSLTPEELEKLRQKYKISLWSCAGGIYGARKQVKVQRALLKKALCPYGKINFINDRKLYYLKKLLALVKKGTISTNLLQMLTGASIELLESVPYVHGILQGIPSEYFVNHAYFRYKANRPEHNVHPARDRCGLIWFAPLLPFTSSAIIEFLKLCKEKFVVYGFDFYTALLMMNPRSAVVLMAIIYDKDSSEETQKAGELYEDLLARMYEKNYQQYRAGIASWENLFSNAPGFLALNNKIKTALDPNNILAPGKYGIGKS